MAKELSDRQKRIVEFIGAHVQKHGYPPTIREIGREVGIPSTSVVKYNLDRLENMGRLERRREVSRGLRLTGRQPATPPATVQVPLLGYIRASEPLPTFDSFSDEMVELTVDMVREPQLVYALRVQGESMRDASVHDGDLVIVRHQQTADPGDMVAAWLGEEQGLTLKRYYPEGKMVRLQPANEAYQPIMVPSGQVEVQGKVIAVIRRLS